MECPKTLSFWESWLQIGCKNVLSICYQNELNMYLGMPQRNLRHLLYKFLYLETMDTLPLS